MSSRFHETLNCENQFECDEWYSIFKRFDFDNDGLISSEELSRMFHTLQYQFNFDERMMNYLIKNVDQNKDYMIDFTEFTNLILSAKKMNMHRLLLYAAGSVIPRTQKTEITRYILHYSCIPPSFFLLIISLLQIIVYLYYVIETGVGFSLTKPAPVNSTLILNPYKKLEIWRYFTYMFIHIGYSHLLTNLAVQILLGIPLELVHKFWRIGLIYILGGISGALSFFAFYQNHSVYLAGASGGVYALLSAHIANVIINWGEMDFSWLRTIILCIFISVDVGSILYNFYINRIFTNVSNISHLGGFISGLLLGIVILRNLKRLKFEAYIWWISLALFIFYIGTCIILIVFPF